MRKIIFTVGFALLMVSCQQNTKKENSEKAEVKQEELAQQVKSEANVTIEGTYQGVFPCASCEGIEVSLKLEKDGTLSLLETYLDQDKLEVESKGTYVLTDDNLVIKFVNLSEGEEKEQSEEIEQHLKVEDGKLFLLNSEGLKDEKYVLTKVM